MIATKALARTNAESKFQVSGDEILAVKNNRKSRDPNNYPQTEAELEATLRAKAITRPYKTKLSISEPARRSNISNLVLNSMQAIAESETQEKIHLRDLDAVKSHTMMYLQKCAEIGVLPDIQGLALCLGHTSRSIDQHCRRNPDDPSAEFLQKCREQFSSIVSNAASNGDINNIFAIFVQKAQYGWKETMDINVIPNNPMGALVSGKELDKIAERYVHDIPEDDVKDVTEESKKKSGK